MRGYILTQTGLDKIGNLVFVENNLSNRQISRETCLDRATVSKALNGERPVNLRTIHKLFLSYGISLEEGDLRKAPSPTRKETMGQNKRDHEMLIGAAKDLEQQASKEHDTTRKQELLDRAKELRARAQDLPDDND